ncbi:MAG: universal stress protein [Desulfobulbia bacterium]
METAHTQMRPYVERILLATDCSAFSEGAVQEAIYFAQACGAALTILHVLEEVLKGKIDIVITGRRGRRGLQKVLMGVVTEKVASMVPCKTLIVPKDFVVESDGVLLATDGSSYSENAEKEALNMVSRCDYLKYICVLSAANSENDLAEASQRVQRVAKSIREKNKKIVIETVAEIASPCDLIVRKAREKKVDMIVMGSHGRTGIQRMLMGSVSAELIASSPCSVLVTK